MAVADSTDARFGDLELRLAGLAPRVSFPPTPDLARQVRLAIDLEQEFDPPIDTNPGLRSWRWLAAAACVLVIGVALLLALAPGVRSTVARYLGLPGIQIVVTDGTATAVPTATGGGLLLGDRVSLANAQVLVGYPIQIPAELGEPDEVYVRNLESGPMVTILYYPRDGLPETVESGVGALLMQFPATDHPGSLAKRVSMGIARVVEVDVNGGTGFWVTGETQLVLDQDPSETFEDLVARDSDNVLLWESGGTTYRLETALTLGDALSVARSIPAPAGTPTP